jgi:internalin A
VLDARLTQEENRVEYWLKIIQSFGGESPVLIVGNKTDQHPLDIDRTGLQKKYPNIVGILETSAATGAGIATLKTEIAKQVDILPHVRDLLPETWFTVKSKLEELGRDKNFITQDEYLGLCATNDVTDETSQHTLIGFLHDLGVVLHFQDDPRLEALGILNPQWVTNGVYKILNSHELFQNQGKLTLPSLNKILDLPEYPSNKRLFIVDMMKKFELCYDIEPDKSFLVPDLLPKDEPFTGEWDGALAFQIHYNVLPSSIISRFIVRMNAFVHKTVWRSGVVLKSGGNTALIKADTEDRKIYIWINGDEPTRRDFLSAIRMEFDAIHKTIAKIESTEKVPLPNQANADPVDYAFLLQLERDARESFPVSIDGKIVDVNVRELLNGIRPSKNQAAKVFISYSHQDKSFVKKLAGELEGQGMKVWWDFDNLKGGQDWQKEIERAIKQCDFFLVALTPDAVTSEWVGNEITYASNAQKTIIPLHVKKCDIPISLIKKQYIDFEKQTRKAAIKELLGILKSENTIE